MLDAAFPVPAGGAADRRKKKIKNWKCSSSEVNFHDTRGSEPTSGCTIGTGFEPTDEGKPGTHRPCRTCSIRIRMCRTTCPRCRATNRIEGSVYVVRKPHAPFLVPGRDPKQNHLTTSSLSSPDSLNPSRHDARNPTRTWAPTLSR